MTHRVSTPALVARHLRAGAGGVLGVAALVLILSLIATGAAPALTFLGDATLRDRLHGLSDLDRDVTSITPGYPQFPVPQPDTVPTTDGVWEGFTAAVDGVRRGADEPLPEVLAPARTVAINPDNPVVQDPRGQRLTLLFDPAYAQDIRIVEGRLPGVAPFARIDLTSGTPQPTRIEGVVSETTAFELGWDVGSVRTLGPPQAPVEVALVGVFEAAQRDAGYWQHVTSVLVPSIFDDGNGPRRVTGAVFANPAAIPLASSLPQGQFTRVWYPTDVERIDAGSAGQVAAALRKFTSISQRIGTSEDGFGILGLRFAADITGAIEVALSQQASTAAVIAMAIAGPVGAAGAVLILGCRLVLESRRAHLRLLSARGASRGQLRALLALEAVTAGAIPSLLGATAAAVACALLLQQAPRPWWFVGAALLGAAPLLILIALAGSAAQQAGRADLGRRRPRRQTILEAVIAILAVASVLLLFLRGPTTSGFDPLITATPLLLSLVACLFALRLYAWPLRAVVRRTRSSSSFAVFLGAARALREPSIGLLPVLALVVGVSVAVSSAVVLSTLEGGITTSARAQTGSDMRITGASFTREQQAAIARIDGVAATTGLSGLEPATLDVGGATDPTFVVVVDAEQLRETQGDGPGLLPPGVSIEPEAGRMPVVVAARTVESIGGSDEVRIGGVDAQVVGVTSGPTPIGARDNWVVIDSSYAVEVVGQDLNDRVVLVRLVDDDAAAGVEADVRSLLGSDIRIDTPDAIVAGIRSGPAVVGMRTALFAATAFAALLGALAIVMTLTLAAPARSRLLALLRILGVPPRVPATLTLWEIGPPAVAAIVAGTLVGVLVPLVVLARVDLRPFTGSRQQPAYIIDAATLALTLGGFIGTALLITAIAVFVSRRTHAASVLRTSEEG